MTRSPIMLPDGREPLCYLATPYSKFPAGIDAGFVAAAKLASLLLRAGIKIYSPIAHTHPIAIHGGIDPLDHAIWLPFDHAMMDVSDVLIVGKLPGWETSYGVLLEIDYFGRAGKPIWYCDPTTLVLEQMMQAA